MNVMIQIGAAKGETAEKTKLTIKAGRVTHKLDAENGACVVHDVEPGSTITMDDSSVTVTGAKKAPRATAKKKAPADK